MNTLDTTPDDHALSKAAEDYLETFYRLSLELTDPDQGVRSVDVAELMGVSKASVNKAVAGLKETGMVAQDRYGRVTLTPEGESYAKVVWRAHRALRSFLLEDLQIDEKTADQEACLMEHVLSRRTLEKLIVYLEKQGIDVPHES